MQYSDLPIFFRWTTDPLCPDKLVGEFDDENYDRVALFNATPVPKDYGTPVVTFAGKKAQMVVRDDVEASVSTPCVSQRLADCLYDIVGDDLFEFVPARIICSDGELEGYGFLNFLKTAPAIDLNASKLNGVPGGFRSYEEIATLTDIPEPSVFRDELYIVYAVVNRSVFLELCTKGLKSVFFSDLATEGRDTETVYYKVIKKTKGYTLYE